jgi:hypothetical protein
MASNPEGAMENGRRPIPPPFETINGSQSSQEIR